MNTLAQSGIFWIAVIMTLVNLYILPTVIAAIRGVEGLGWIIVLNLLPSGIGWPAALIAALWLPRRESPQPPPARTGQAPARVRLGRRPASLGHRSQDRGRGHLVIIPALGHLRASRCSGQPGARPVNST